MKLLISTRQEIINVRTVNSFKPKLKKMVQLFPCRPTINDNKFSVLKSMMFVVKICHITAELLKALYLIKSLKEPFCSGFP